MGMLKIETLGSFKPESKTFSAMEHGHAHAVAGAIAFLSTVVLPEAIANDHKCHDEGLRPSSGFEVSPKR
jgi:hypothetical protein